MNWKYNYMGVTPLTSLFKGSIKLVAGCDDIIRQHKAACLRVTALLACNDLLWIGTSAGVLLTVPIPHIKPSTQRMSQVPTVTGELRAKEFFNWFEMSSM